MDVKKTKRVSSFPAHAHETHAAFLQCCGPTNQAGGEPVFLTPDDEPGTLRY